MLETEGEQGPTAGDDTGTATRRLTSLAPARDLVVIACAVFLCVAFVPALVSAPFSARFAILLGFTPVGVVALIALCIRRDLASIAATGFVAMGVISALLSDHVRISLIGQMGKESSALLFAAFFGWWAIGRHMSERGRSLLPYALLIGLGISGLVAILQVAIDTGTTSEFGGSIETRGSGLTASPVQLGALMAAAVAIASTLALATSGRRLAAWGGAIVFYAAAANLSGSRVAMVTIVAVLLVLLLIDRTFRVPVLFAAVVAGTFLSTIIDRAGDASSTSRLDAQGSDRLVAWKFGVQSFFERPIAGFGPGGFRPAIQGRFTAEFVRTSAYDEQHGSWFDAHNLAVEVLVTVGIIGLFSVGVFSWFALRHARGPLLAGFAAIAMSWAMQPWAVSTAPIAMLCLGASAPMLTTSEAWKRQTWLHPAMVAAGALGATCALGYAFIDLRLDAAIASGNAERIEDAARPFGNDAIVADFVAQGWANAYFYEGAERTNLVKWAAEPALREPDRPYWWSKLAGTRLAFQDYEGAREALDRAIALQPWSPTAWPLMLSLAEKTDDPDLEALATEKVCAMGLAACPDDSGG